MFIGDTLVAETEVLDKRVKVPSYSRYCHCRTTGFKQRGEVVMTFDRVMLVPKKGMPSTTS